MKYASFPPSRYFYLRKDGNYNWFYVRKQIKYDKWKIAPKTFIHVRPFVHRILTRYTALHVAACSHED